jgi:hypothetical protein
MQQCYCQEAVDCILKDIRENNELFEDLTVVFREDFQQILSIMIKGS